jgi:hypothetical protein
MHSKRHDGDYLGRRKTEVIEDKEKVGGDDGVRTCPSSRHREATSGMCLTLRTRDLANWQPEATPFPSMLAPC